MGEAGETSSEPFSWAEEPTVSASESALLKARRINTVVSQCGNASLIVTVQDKPGLLVNIELRFH
uniref:Uncharacterized protein n=1 Tax=Anguilla anguilla TaxID=7936 RepID=A0A0E9PBB4_ANGAN